MDQPSGTKLYLHLKQSIRDGKLKPGDRLTPSRELRAAFNLSHHATLAAMERLEREGFVLRKQGSGTYVSELPNHVEWRAHTRTIRVIVSTEGTMQEAFMRPLVQALRERLSALECLHDIVAERPSDVADIMDSSEADVFVWVCPSVPLDVRAPAVPVVMVAQDLVIAWPGATGRDVVTVDHRQGGAVAAKHLKEAGCRHVALLAARGMWIPRIAPLANLRMQGFRMEWGEELPEPAVVWVEQHSVEDGARAVNRILELKPRPDAVFAMSDELAMGLSSALIAHGLEPGRDIKLVGFDAQPQMSASSLELTSVAAPVAEMGATAALLAVERAANPQMRARWVALACDMRKGSTG